jgi:hypothetical protein
MMDIWPSPQWEPFWFVLCFAGFWIGIMMLLSFPSGWWSLARRFRASTPPSGVCFRFVSGSMGLWFLPVSYSSCLTLTVGGEGIHLAMFFPFRPFHPPLFIPSAMIESAVEKYFLFFLYAKIRIRDHWPTLTIYGWAGRRIVELHGRPLRTIEATVE